jgi:hypothetical protein
LDPLLVDLVPLDREDDLTLSPSTRPFLLLFSLDPLRVLDDDLVTLRSSSRLSSLDLDDGRRLLLSRDLREGLAIVLGDVRASHSKGSLPMGADWTDASAVGEFKKVKSSVSVTMGEVLGLLECFEEILDGLFEGLFASYEVDAGTGAFRRLLCLPLD